MLFFALVLILVVVMWVGLTQRTSAVERALEQLRHRLDEIERARSAEIPDAAREDVAEAARKDLTGTTPGPSPPLTPHVGAPPQPPPAGVPAPPKAPPTPARGDMELLVGGVWLQNVGSVLLLVGFFFLILWGYTTGRFGPWMLVVAGVLAGLGLVWRGDRMHRSVRGVGHALIGVGAGVVWLAFYLGHFRLHVMPSPAAFAALLAASVFTGVLGLRYRVQTIAALGVIGAHVPNVLRAVTPLYGFSLSAGMLLGHLVAVNALVFALAARVGWSALALVSMLLSAIAWVACIPASSWSWPLEFGLAALFAGLGIAPVLWLVRPEGRVRPVDLALVATAPLALILASTGMFLHARSVHVAIMLIVLAALYLLVTLWVDARRPERDLWRPLVAAAVLFLTLATERALNNEFTALAWTVEGVILLWLGLAPRAQWLRFCGYVIVALGGLMTVVNMAVRFDGHPMPVANPAAVRDALTLAAMFFALWRLGRERGRFGVAERTVGHLFFIGVHLLLMVWFAREAEHLAYALEDGGAWRRIASLPGAAGKTAYRGLWTSAVGLAWMAQASWLVVSGARRSDGVARGIGYLEAGITTVVITAALLFIDGWTGDRWPLLHRDGLLVLGAIVLAVFTAASLARRRDSFGALERRSPEAWALLASFLLLLWITREAGHVAREIVDIPPRTTAGANFARRHALAATFTSVGWLAQAVIGFVVGWVRRSAFMRWIGLVLVGITVVKFLIVDLAHADPFWRFLTAIVVGAAMLALSYAYQRRAARGPGPG